MLTQDEFKDWTFIWAFKNAKKHRFLEENPNTIVVKQTARVYEKKLIRAKYWITNYRVPDHVWPQKDQVYVQCWHGTPLKRLGYDLETSENAIDSIADIRKKYAMDAEKFNYILSPSGFASEKFTSAWNLKETKMEDKVMEIGYPRNDFLINHTQEDIRMIKEKLEIPEDKKVILYAPTWRENQHLPGEGYQFQLPVDFKRWREVLGEEYVVLFRAHYFISNSFDFEAFQGFVYDVSQMDDINPLYLAADVLITDYSSVFFDYANLRRPILFFMYDYEQYKHEMRDFYFDIHMLPGPVLMNQEEVLKTLKNLPDMVDKYEKKYAEFNNVFNPHRERCSEKYLREWMR